MKIQDRAFEMKIKLELQIALDFISNKFGMKQTDITFKYMEEKSMYLEKSDTIIISKEHLENFYLCLALSINELEKQISNPKSIPKLKVLSNAFKILSKKKIISADIKEELLTLGFKEVNIGTQRIHEINSKELKFDFFGHEVAVGIFARYISYGCNRLYRALVINL